MMIQSTPPRIITLLLTQLGLEQPLSSTPSGLSCTLTVGNIDIELTESATQCLTLQCYPGALTEPTNATLSTLLAENQYQEDLPVINVGLVPEAPANVLIWSRMAGGEATADALGYWFACFNERAQALHGWLDAGAPALMMASGETERPALCLH
ncbi:hypothetical protein QN362_17230 [Actimicrobium sp. CCC2.4]|uniref:hypothetical protein n=1 Tax=Actimicrobium sp. CCC2.4 TaxID=3048606 RepID=UPI002AC8D732|nr:hypothetical protein [Actimicrobium sp. CCC2.4]MEB0137081.1 hypothetical protein [Actimicrobium sp. CCC2.4]WPX33665.1 hypothetical protein RHM62_07520 [Actimicrobium sp. CCC2.4]